MAAKVENHQGKNCVKLTVFDCANVNWEKEHIDTLWKEVVKLETELEISPEEDRGWI